MRKTLILLVVLGAASAADAQTVFFDNINGFTAWSGTSSWVLRGSGLSNPQTFAQQFTSSATGTVGSIELSIQHQVSSATQTGTVAIFADSGSGSMSSLQLGSTQNFTTNPVWDSSSVMNLSGPAASLISGFKYWVVVTPSANSDLGWRVNPNSPTGNYAYQTNAASPPIYSTGRLAGMKISAVPEPATFAIFGIGLVALLRKRTLRTA